MMPSQMLRQARLDAGLTQSALATRLGVSQPIVARLERPSANPTWETLIRALRATGHDVQLTKRHAVPLDEGQLRERLALTPAERLRMFQDSHDSLDRLRGAARNRER
jgi:transcriptional regulator with XRE-family HTH domain